MPEGRDLLRALEGARTWLQAGFRGALHQALTAEQLVVGSSQQLLQLCGHALSRG